MATNAAKKPKSIFEYRSYRKYLQYCFDVEKKCTPNATLATFAKPFGLSGPSFKLILQGQRNLTVERIHRIAKVLKLGKEEIEFFEAMVLRDQSQSSGLRRYYGSRLKDIDLRKRSQSVRVANRQLISQWYIPALLIYLIDIKKSKGHDDLRTKSISKDLGITTEEVEKGLDVLKSSGLLRFDAEDKIHFVFDKISHTLGQVSFLESVFDEARKRLPREFDNPETFFTSYAFSTSKDSLKAWKQDIKVLMGKYLSAEAPSTEQVVQVSIQMFPVYPSKSSV